MNSTISLKAPLSYLITIPLLLALTNETIYSFPAGDTPQGLSAVAYTMRDGLPSNQINVICQDSRGYLWIGTNNGLSVYDGAAFTNYSVVQGLANNWITDIQESRSEPGVMWIGTNAGGACQFCGGNFTSVTPPGDLNVLFEDRKGTLWFVLNDALFRKTGNNVSVVRHMRPSSRGAILELSNGEVVTGLDRSISIFDLDGRLLRSCNLPLERGDQIYSMSLSSDGFLWVVSNGKSVFQLRDTTIVRFQHFKDRHPFYAQEDSHGGLWIRTSEGITDFPDITNRWNAPPRQYALNDALPETWAGPAIFDREDNLWIGTWAKGLLKVSDRRIHQITVRALTDGTSDTSGHIWFSSDDAVAELSHHENGAWSLYRHERSELPNLAGVDLHNMMWYSSGRDPKVLYGYEIQPLKKGRSAVRRRYRVRLLSNGAWTTFDDRENRLWISLVDGSIQIVDLPTRKNLPTDSIQMELPKERVSKFFQDRRGNIWIGFWSQGLAMVPSGNHSAARLFTHADGLPYDGIRSLCEDPEGLLWIGTRFGGLSCYKDGKFRTVSMKEGLESNSIWQVAADTHNRLWMRTDVGLECIDRTSLQVLPVQPEFRSERLRSFGIYKDEYLWCLSGDAFWIFDVSESPPHIIPPPIYLKLLTVNGLPQPFIDNKRFSYAENNFVIEFVSPSFRNDRSLRFQYRMIGIDSAWSPPAKERSVTYASLNPGSFTFEVRALTPEALVSTYPASISFIIQPPFWRSWWFLLAAALSFLSLGPFVHYRRISKLRTAQEAERKFARQLITSQEQERKRISHELHDSIGQSLLLVKNASDIALKSRNSDNIDRFAEISSLASEALDQVREISSNLRPYQLDSIGLSRTLRSLINRIGHSTTLRFSASIENVDGLFRRDAEIGIFRILQEGINNIVKHAHATNVKLAVERKEAFLQLYLEDDGVGFGSDSNDKHAGEGFGLKGIDERVQMLGGTCTITSTPGNGTRIDIRLPVDAP